MPFNDDIQTTASGQIALLYATQITTPTALSANTVPRLAVATQIWNRQYARVVAELRKAGISATVTDASEAEGWLQEIEACLTSAACLMAKGTVEKEEFAFVRDLMARGESMLKEIPAKRPWLLGNGATAYTPAASFGNNSSWHEQADPDFDETPGTGDIPYAYVPEIVVGGDL